MDSNVKTNQLRPDHATLCGAASGQAVTTTVATMLAPFVPIVAYLMVGGYDKRGEGWAATRRPDIGPGHAWSKHAPVPPGLTARHGSHSL
jgi:hypothetical protein